MISLKETDSQVLTQFEENLNNAVAAEGFARPNYFKKVSNAAAIIAAKEGGIDFLYENISKITRIGIFKNTPWENPQKLSASLVGGTLKSNDDASVAIEILSELRIQAIADKVIQHPDFTAAQAKEFIEDCLVFNLDLLFPVQDEFNRINADKLTKAYKLFAFLSQKVPADRLKKALLEEISSLTAQRPIMVDRILGMLKHIKKELDLSEDNSINKQLKKFLFAHFSPYLKDLTLENLEAYKKHLATYSKEALEGEAVGYGERLEKTGLTSPFHAVLIRHLLKEHLSLLPKAIGLTLTGRESYLKHKHFVEEVIKNAIFPSTAQSILGLKLMLNRGLLHREPVINGFKRLMVTQLHPEVETRLNQALKEHHEVFNERMQAKQFLLAGTLSVLGQPLGIGQGFNPTCQSARGISLWSQHAPGKLLNYIIAAAVDNNLTFQFEGTDIAANILPKGLFHELDLRLDSVSILLVPLLDPIYNEMMRRASIRGEDPHKWVNHALYGHWIPIGFASAFDPVSQSIMGFDDFIRKFYASHHPKFNGGIDLVYPNPVGIFITTSNAKLLGFHAVSLQRIAKDPQGNVRAYFYNPNNEGRQDWGQSIRPSVEGHGERAGESSILFHEFASRLYAFHFHPNEIGEVNEVNAEVVAKVRKMAEESWGTEYQWL